LKYDLTQIVCFYHCLMLRSDVNACACCMHVHVVVFIFLRDIPPSELSLRIEAAETLRSSSFGTGDTHLNLSSIIDKQTRVNKNKFNVYFHVPDTSRGIDGEVTEPLSASDRRVKGQESTSRSEAPLETEDHIWNITSPLSPHYGPHEPIQTAW